MCPIIADGLQSEESISWTVEANVKGWLPSVDTADHVKDDECFNFLKTNGVCFYDDTLSPHIEPQLPPEPSEEEEY